MKKQDLFILLALIFVLQLKSQSLYEGIRFPDTSLLKDLRPRNFIAKGKDGNIYLGFGGLNIGNTRLQSKYGL